MTHYQLPEDVRVYRMANPPDPKAIASEAITDLRHPLYIDPTGNTFYGYGSDPEFLRRMVATPLKERRELTERWREQILTETVEERASRLRTVIRLA